MRRCFVYKLTPVEKHTHTHTHTHTCTHRHRKAWSCRRSPGGGAGRLDLLRFNNSVPQFPWIRKQELLH